MSAEPQTVHFSVDGSFLVELAREHVMSSQFRKGIDILLDSLDGMTYDYAIQILKGEKTLVGRDSDIKLIDDDITDTPYKKQLNYLYDSVLDIKGKLYTPYTYIDSYGSDDLEFACDGDSGLVRVMDKAEFNRRRSLYYADNPNDLVLTVFVDELNRDMDILFKRFHDYPIWMTASKEVSEIVNKSFEKLEKRGYVKTSSKSRDDGNAFLSKLENMVSVPETDDLDNPKNLENRRLQILQQNEELYDGEMVEFDFKGTVGVKQVPIGPLNAWAVRNTPERQTVKWQTISPMGIKMLVDDPAHTDWMIGAGIDLDAYFDDQEFRERQYDLFSDMQKRFTMLKGAVLLSGKLAIGNVVHAKPGQLLTDNQIAIMPHAGVEYMDVFMTAGATITEKGGAMSHMAVNGLPYNKTLLRIPDASKRYKEGTGLEIEPNGEITTLVG